MWIDDCRPAPPGYLWVKSVNEAKKVIREVDDKFWDGCEIIDIDHDAGAYAMFGGDYIKFLDWLEETNHNFPIRIHSMNPVGVENMRRIIEKNGWREIK